LNCQYSVKNLFTYLLSMQVHKRWRPPIPKSTMKWELLNSSGKWYDYFKIQWNEMSHLIKSAREPMLKWMRKLAILKDKHSSTICINRKSKDGDIVISIKQTETWSFATIRFIGRPDENNIHPTVKEEVFQLVENSYDNNSINIVFQSNGPSTLLLRSVGSSSRRDRSKDAIKNLQP